MAVDEVVAVAPDRLMLGLLDGHDQIASESVLRAVALAFEPKHSAWLHAWFHLDFLFNLHLGLSFTITLSHCLQERESLCRSVKELKQGAAALDR